MITQQLKDLTAQKHSVPETKPVDVMSEFDKIISKRMESIRHNDTYFKQKAAYEETQIQQQTLIGKLQEEKSSLEQELRSHKTKLESTEQAFKLKS
jgi:hypothetical protein